MYKINKAVSDIYFFSLLNNSVRLPIDVLLKYLHDHCSFKEQKHS